MPSRKQRRRRQKQQRHEWEEVYVDEEGRELDAEEAAELEQASAGATTTKSSRGRSQSRPTDRRVDPPSWRRTFRRGLLFFPLMLITIFLLAGDGITTAQKLVQTFVLMAFFLPFSYFMDSVLWRSYQRRLAKGAQKKN
jgi:hypothetical protein